LIAGEPVQRAEIAVEEGTRREIESLVELDGEEKRDAGAAASPQ
jgi:hypothetical protein